MRRIVLISLTALALLAGVLVLLTTGDEAERGQSNPRRGFREEGRDRASESEARATRLVPGVVIDLAGVPVGSAMVRCLEFPDDEVPADAEGAFQLRIPERGALRVEANAPGYVVETRTLDAEATRFVRIVLTEGNSAAFEVRASDGSPVERARVRLRAVTAHPFDKWRRRRTDQDAAITDGAGEVRIGPVLPGPYSLRVTAAGFALHHERWECFPGPEIRHVVVLSPGASVSGMVWGPDGEPLGETLVEPFGMPECATRTDATGAFRIRDLPAGTVLLCAKSDLHGETYYGESAGWKEPVGVHVEPDRPVGGIGIRFGAAGRVVGCVVDDRGEPVGSAKVTVQVLGCKGKSPSTVSTDAAGRFAVAPIGLARARRIQISVRSGAHAPETLEPRTLQPGQSEDLGSIALLRLGSISGRVVSPDGSPDRSGWVRCGNRAASVAEDGSFRCVDIVPGAVRVLAGSGRDEEQCAAVPTELTLAPGQHLEGVEISLDPTLAIEGRVVWATGEPCAGARVAVVPSRGFEVTIPPFELKDATSGPEGWFVVPGLLPGEYRVGLLDQDADGFRLARKPESLETRAGSVKVDLVLTGRGARVFGEVVTGAEAVPVLRYSVRFVTTSSSAPVEQVSRWIEDSNGRLEQFLAAGCRWTVEVRAPGHPSVRVGPFDPDADKPTDLGRIRVDATGVLTGRLTASQGVSVAGARIEVIDRMGGVVVSELRSDGEGRFRSSPLAPGRYALIAYSAGCALAVAPQVFLEAEKVREVPLVFPKSANLLVRTRDKRDSPVSGAGLRVAQSGLHWLSPRLGRRLRNAGPEGPVSDSPGIFRWANLRPGKCILTVSAPGYVDASVQATLVEGKVTEVEVRLSPSSE